MGGLIRRQKLTESQYTRANRVMCLILMVSYLAYMIVDSINAKAHPGTNSIRRQKAV